MLGNVQVTGHGGGGGTSGGNFGVEVDTAGGITAGGTGTVTVQGSTNPRNRDKNLHVLDFHPHVSADFATELL